MIKSMAMSSILILSLILGIASPSNASSFLGVNNMTLSEPLGADEAFMSEFDYKEGEDLNIIFDIKPDHYLYKDKIEVKYNNVKQNIINNNHVDVIEDDFFGKSKIHRFGFSVKIKNDFNFDTIVELKYQGCSELFNLCYPPQMKTFEIKGKNEKESIDYNEIKSKIITEQDKNIGFNKEGVTDLVSTTDPNVILELINQQKESFLIYLIFIVLGIFMAFTPCIYPLIPVVIASTSNSKNKSIATLSYILGMVIAYTAIGLFAGYLNFNIQIFAQNKFLIYGTGVILFVLAMYMFGFINLILPNGFNNKITQKINQLNSDKYWGQILIGFLSSLILSPCSVAPLLGVLIFINQLGEPIFGSSLLASMAFGMGIPIFLLSTSFNKFMPKSGIWMNEIKNIIGIIILVVMIYLLTSEIGEQISYIFYSLIFMIYGLHLLGLNTRKKIGVLIFTFSILLIIDKFGIDNVVKNQNYSIESSISLKYTEVENLTELNDLVKSSERPIFIDYYADWCITCVKMDSITLKDLEIIKELNNNYFMVKIDLTDITSKKQAIMDKKNILAIPYYSIIEKDKTEYVYTGELDVESFKKILTKHSG